MIATTPRTPMVTERQVSTAPGGAALGILLTLALLFTAGVVWGASSHAPAPIVVCLLGDILTIVLLTGLFTVNPNEAKVAQLFGRYVGSVKTQGFHWANPFYRKHTISLRIRNFVSEKSKVNDKDGNPIEIAAVVVWKVVDTAEASFEVDSYVHFVEVQSEAALRNLASQHPYDSDDDKLSLRGHIQEVASQLKNEIQERLSKGGVEVIEARISYLAYAPEIAVPMLQRQQAGAIIAARQKIVEGAVGMVEMALTRLSQNKVVELDEERKAQMVSNLLVVLCGERSTQPVVNTGTIYQ